VNIEELMDENLRLKAEVERLTKQNALATPRHLIASQDIKTLREQIEELKLENSQYEEHHKYGQNVITSLREEVERLTAFTTRTIIPNEELQADVKALRVELADAQESNHILNETIARLMKGAKR